MPKEPIPQPESVEPKSVYCSPVNSESVPQCPGCESDHVRVVRVEFMWSGLLARATEVAWCHQCDLVFVVPMAQTAAA